jgi:transcriptional regulator with XRE-family HTH domain
MNLQLQELRKKSGYSSRKAFAAAFGEAERKVKSWERGETKLSLEDACRIADFFDVTLDELAGRWEYVNKIPSATPDEVQLVDDYRKSDERGKDNILDVAKREKIASKRDVVPVGDEVR